MKTLYVLCSMIIQSNVPPLSRDHQNILTEMKGISSKLEEISRRLDQVPGCPTGKNRPNTSLSTASRPGMSRQLSAAADLTSNRSNSADNFNITVPPNRSTYRSPNFSLPLRQPSETAEEVPTCTPSVNKFRNLLMKNGGGDGGPSPTGDDRC